MNKPAISKMKVLILFCGGPGWYCEVVILKDQKRYQKIN